MLFVAQASNWEFFERSLGSKNQSGMCSNRPFDLQMS